MKIKTWQSFSSNNSSAFRLVARFADAETAQKHAKELESLIREHEEELNERKTEERSGILTRAQENFTKSHGILWGDDYLFEGGHGADEYMGAVSSENTLMVYQEYCLGFPELGEFLRKLGGAEVKESTAHPTVTVVIRLPQDERAGELQAELETFFHQARSGLPLSEWKKLPPWEQSTFSLYAPVGDVLYYSDGRTLIFSLPLHPQNLTGLRTYLEEKVSEMFRILLCDESLPPKLETLSLTKYCPECRSDALQYLSSEVEKLDQDHVLCSKCGGMFTLNALRELSPLEKIPGAQLHRIHGQGKLVFTVSREGRIFRSRAGGKFKRKYTGSNQLWGLLCLDEKRILASGFRGTLLFSEDGGDSWRDIETPISDSFYHISNSPEGNLYVVGSDNLLRSKDEAKSWELLETPQKRLLDFFPVNELLLFLVGRNGSIQRSQDGGESWEALTSGVKTDLCRMTMFSESEGLIVGDDSVILTTMDGGDNWQRKDIGLVGDIEDLTRDENERLYAITGSGRVLVTGDRGQTWSIRETGLNQKIWGVWSAPGDRLMMVGEEGIIFNFHESAFRDKKDVG